MERKGSEWSPQVGRWQLLLSAGTVLMYLAKVSQQPEEEAAVLWGVQMVVQVVVQEKTTEGMMCAHLVCQGGSESEDAL